MILYYTNEGILGKDTISSSCLELRKILHRLTDVHSQYLWVTRVEIKSIYIDKYPMYPHSIYYEIGEPLTIIRRYKLNANRSTATARLGPFTLKMARKILDDSTVIHSDSEAMRVFFK